MKFKTLQSLSLCALMISCTENSKENNQANNASKVNNATTARAKAPASDSAAPSDTIKKLKIPGNLITKKLLKSYPALIVPANGSKTLTGPTENYSVIIMGQNSKIIIDPSLPFCQITAGASFIEDDCQLISTAAQGAKGKDARDYYDDNGYGVDGLMGRIGEPGAVGSPGNSLKINIDLNKLGTLEIISKGGKGGNGGNGGRGQRGGNGRRVFNSGGNGGGGGTGGPGGSGGPGGQIELEYWFNDTPTNVGGRIPPTSVGGDGGDGGDGGAAGGGGNAINGFGHRSGGNPGVPNPGAKGAKGSPGPQGPLPISRLIKSPL